jgi:hypothetical protein
MQQGDNDEAVFHEAERDVQARPGGPGRPAPSGRQPRRACGGLQDRHHGGDTVSVGRTDNFKLRVTANGEDLPVQQAASSIVKLTITAANNFANTIDLAGINLADFPQLNQVLVKIDGRDTVNRGAGRNPAGSQTIDGQRYAVFTQANTTLKITDLRTTPPPAHPAAPAHGIVIQLVPWKHRRQHKLFVQVRDAVNGS